MRSRILSLWLPNLATDRLLRQARRAAGGHEGAGPLLYPARPLATFVNHKGALRLDAVCARAREAGLAPGTMLADARAMVPALQVQAADPAADARLLADLAVWCERYTPSVALDRSHEPVAGGALWLDVTGCAHLFGGEAALRDDLLARLRRQDLAAAAAIADAPGAAWAVARYGDDAPTPVSPIVPPGGARVALAPLPVAALRLDPDAVRMLERLGLERIESLYPLPRQALVARFGDALATRLDQAESLVDEPIAPRPPRPAHRAQLSFAEPIAEAETLARVTGRLLAELCGALAAMSLGARRLTLAFYRVDNSTAAVAVGTSRPCRDARQLERLFAEKLEQVDPGFGIERALLEADVVEPLLPEPLAWRAMGAGDLDQARDLAPLVDRLSNRLGRDTVSQLVPRASHIPERAQERAPALGAQTAPFPARGLHGPAPSRPLRLLARPEPIEAVAPVPDAPPVLFRWRHALHKVATVRGPERLAPEWWRTPDIDPAATTRDYFAVEDTEGGRFWLFREGLYIGAAMPRWYLHGLFG
jgi:protein ImuB